MTTFSVDYQQKLYDENLHIIDIRDTENDGQNDQDAWNELRRQTGVFRDNAFIKDRSAELPLSPTDIKPDIRYRFIELVPVWVPGTIEVLAKNEDAAIVEARAIIGGDIAIDDVEEIS